MRRSGFTLVEMVVVMMIIVVVVGVVAPSLKRFLSGRNLNNEARRFLSVMHYASLRAVNEGVPVDLWMNVKKGQYGVAASGGYTETETNEMDFALDSGLQMMASPAPGTLTQSNWWTPQMTRSRGRLVVIRFQPDGFISDSSPQNVVFEDAAGTGGRAAGSQVWVVENANHRSYDIDFNHRTVARF